MVYFGEDLADIPKNSRKNLYNLARSCISSRKALLFVGCIKYLLSSCEDLDKNSIWLSDLGSFYENYTKLDFDAKHFKIDLNRG